MMKQKLRADILIIGIVLIIAILFMVIPQMFKGNTPAEVVVLQDGMEVARYALWQEQTITLTDAYGGYNLVLIQDGTVTVTDADCPDKLCVNQRAIDSHGESIICLPHKLIVQIASGKDNGIDAMTN